MSAKAAGTSTNLLQNTKPVDYQDANFRPVFEKLQGNILKGHGRDFSANIFIQFHLEGDNLRSAIMRIAKKYVTSAFVQLEESRQFQSFGVPGTTFGNFMLTARAYRKLGLGDRLQDWFEVGPENSNAAFPQKANFIEGMLEAAEDLGDRPADLKAKSHLEPLEKAYLDKTIDALLLLADDGEQHLLRITREFVTQIESEGVASVVAVELGKALRNEDGEGIEHFGYVDGRSQPLFLAGDFKNLAADGSINLDTTSEKVNDKASRRESGALDIWNPFASLELALVRDEAANDEQALGSYFVFRKLEQDVLRFSMAEQQLADEMELQGNDRERAGAMVVGRFRDGTPLVLSETDGLIPAKANNFRYDGLDANLDSSAASNADRLGTRCPFHAHIRKTNPRQSVNATSATAAEIKDAERLDRSRRIVRRGIPFGTRTKHPSVFQALDDLPTGGVGLLFACFQHSIIKQFAFMQKTWANNVQFKVPLGSNPNLAPTGLDPIVGQPLDANAGSNPDQNWRKEYGGDPGQTDPPVLTDVDLKKSHSVPHNFSEFVKFRGGEFFFAPSIPFLLNLGTPPATK